jgi:hypothetical protein
LHKRVAGVTIAGPHRGHDGHVHYAVGDAVCWITRALRGMRRVAMFPRDVPYLPNVTVSEQSAVIGPVVILLFFIVALQPLTELVLYFGSGFAVNVRTAW